MAKQAPKTVNWIEFDPRVARMKRLISSGGKAGLLLLTGDTEEGRRVAAAAAARGFVPTTANPRVLRYFPGQSKEPIMIRDLARELGGEVVPVPARRVFSDEMTVKLVSRAKNEVGTPEAAEPRNELRPDPDSVRPIGLNMRGEEVVRDDQGRFFRRISDDEGEGRFVHESAGGQAPLFLRAARREDLTGIAAGLLRMARRQMHQDDFDRVIDAALEEGPTGRLDMDRATAVEDVRTAMLRQITAQAIENGSDRGSFFQAIRLANNTDFVLSRRTGTEGLQPSSSVLALLRRLTQGHDNVDFRGHSDLSVALPRVKSETSRLQVHDFSDTAEDGLAAVVFNALSRRPADGSSVFLFPDGLDEETLARLRGDVGRTYGLETVAEIAPGLADGVQDGRGMTIFFVGEQRPEPLDTLPQAAMRTFNVVTSDDLPNLEREVLRSRGRIREFNRGEVAEAQAEGEDEREENVRQRPYKPLSQVGEPFTMIPMALEGATYRALQRASRDFEERGGVDAVVAGALGRSVADLGEILTPEQVDAIGLQINAQERERGFLLSDQTGIGKGRSLAAMLRAHIRHGPEQKALYFTESATINIPDVCRDLKAVGAWNEIRVGFLSSGTRMLDVRIDPVTGNPSQYEMRSLTPKEQQKIFEEGEWPADYDVLITTYSKFNCGEDALPSQWISQAMDENTMVLLDEAHNALNPKSNTGRNVRAAIDQIPAGQVVYGTGTPSRNPAGLNLYKPLLPRTAGEGLDRILEDLQTGGEVAQEAFTSMLAEDGVMMRRDHDLANIDFQVNLPDDQRMLRYQDVMNRFSPVVEGMIDASLQIGEIVGRRQAMQFRDMIRRGVPEQVARQETNELSQYSLAITGPLSNLARITMNALKVEQVVEVAAGELDINRKPLITFHSTNAALLNEMVRRTLEDGTKERLTEEEIAELPHLTLKDQIRRIHETVYRVRLDGEQVDGRELSTDVAEAARRVDEMIEELPDDLSVSPIDDLKERLEANGIRVGEISGRTLCYRGGQIQKRTKEERDRRATIDAFNEGELDALIYNSAGATGGSYHASPEFTDQRGRTMIELETPVDIIKYIQSLGRGNRYGQVENAKVTSVMTGLTPEMRILQQRNGKLRSLGASVDGNRAHPLLLNDVPDLLNRVGDEATRNVLLSMSSLARRLGFEEFAEAQADEPQGQDEIDDGSGTATKGTESLANKVMARSLMLPASGQDDLIKRIVMEFEVLIEELDSRNANPLKPKEFPGQIDIRATSLFSGQERDEEDLDTSTFLAPLYISTGSHEFTEDAVSAEQLISMVERCVTLHGADGLAPFAERINQNLPTLMRPHLPDGYDMEAALETPENVPGRFRKQHAKLTDLAWLLENLKPGVSMRFPSIEDPTGRVQHTVVDISAPSEAAHVDLSSAYKVKLIAPGMSKPVSMAVSRLLFKDQEQIRFRPGLSEGVNEPFLEEFSEMANLRRSLPVQVLQGNVLQAISVARQNNLGTVSLYRDTEGQVSRGIVVHDSKVDMERLPVNVPSGRVAAEAVHEALMDEGRGGAGPWSMRLWGGMDPGGKPGDRADADIIVRVGSKTAVIDMVPMRRSNEDFFRARPRLHEALWGEPMPDHGDTPTRVFRRAGTKHKYLVKMRIDEEEGRERLYRILSMFDGTPMQMDGSQRGHVNEAIARINRIEAGLEQEAPRGGDVEDAEIVGEDTPDEVAAERAEGWDGIDPEADGGIDMDNVNWG